MNELINKFKKVEPVTYPSAAPEKPLVSVVVQTYQHAAYIAECLDGILMQKTDFPFEILVGEDESTDGTREICIEYAKKYPDKIRLFLHSRENVIFINNHPSGRFNLLWNLQHAKGKYIAICEGDDYWTNSNKLQTQYNISEQFNLSLCVHSAKHLFPNGQIKRKIPFSRNKYVDLKKIISEHGGLFATSSYFFLSNHIKNFPDWIRNIPVTDYYLTVFAAMQGPVYYINKTMSVYRRNSINSWSSEQKDINWYNVYFNSHSIGLNKLKELLTEDYYPYLEKRKKRLLSDKIIFIAKLNKKIAFSYLISNFHKISLKDNLVIAKKILLK